MAALFLRRSGLPARGWLMAWTAADPRCPAPGRTRRSCTPSVSKPLSAPGPLCGWIAGWRPNLVAGMNRPGQCPRATLLTMTIVARRRAACQSGAGEETRTPDIFLGKEVLYQLSYTRKTGRPGRTRTGKTDARSHYASLAPSWTTRFPTDPSPEPFGASATF